MTMSYAISRRIALRLLGTATALSLACSGVIPGARAQQSEPQSSKAKEIEELVNKATQLVDAKGSAMFGEFRQKGSAWFKDDGTYIFVMDMKGNELFNAAFPDAEGKNYMEQKDKNGKLILRAFFDVLDKQDAGWVDYMWQKPGPNQVIAKKWAYIKKVNIDGTPGLLGIGIYVD
jgi:signal transduction histidine kinase